MEHATQQSKTILVKKESKELKMPKGKQLECDKSGSVLRINASPNDWGYYNNPDRIMNIYNWFIRRSKGIRKEIIECLFKGWSIKRIHKNTEISIDKIKSIQQQINDAIYRRK